jgi:hypothetical protein
MFCVGTLSNAGTRRKDKMWEGLCQEGENDRIVTGAVAVARLGEFEKFVGGGSARGCAHMAEPFWEYTEILSSRCLQDGTRLLRLLLMLYRSAMLCGMSPISQPPFHFRGLWCAEPLASN